jgi:ABC-type transporter Mla subunit MlaD
MKVSEFALIILLFILLTQCKSPSEQINDAFKTVDNSLNESNQFLSDSMNTLYSSITSSREKNSILASKADSIFNATNVAFKFMDSLKKFMQLQDTLGTDINLATNIFIISDTGDILKKKLLDVYKLSYSALMDNSKRQALIVH